MNKAYNRINWQNHPSDETPLNETNLNKIDVAADEIDNRVILLNTTKFDKSEAQGLFKDVSLDRSSGVITFTLYNGATKTLDTLLERIAINFDYDAATQRLVITLDDGAVKYVDMSALITQYEFLDTDTVAFSIDSTGKVSALVKEGSIQEKHLQPNYLADIKVEVAKAQASQTAAAKSESNAKASETVAKASESNAAASATKAQSYAVGGTNSRTGEDTDNAKYYSQQAAEKQNIATNNANTAIAKASEAAESAEAAKISESVAAQSATTATEKAKSATDSADSANKSATTATENATKAQNYAVGETNSAKYYYEKAKEAVGGSVTGVKGNAESSYRTGNVNITPENIGAVSKDEFDGLEIGGRNLALDTSSQYSTPFTGFNGCENQTPFVAEVLTDGLKEGDIITVSIVFKYNNIVPTSGHSARFSLLQGYGNVNGYKGGFPAGKILEGISGDDEIEIVYQTEISKRQMENHYWSINIRCDWIQSGSMQWKRLKIEKGNKATDWTPAPEDVDSSIAEVKNDINNISTSVDSVQTQIDDLTGNIQQNDLIANISSSSSTFVTKSITIVSADYREYVVVLCNGDEFDHTVINTYTWLSSMVNGYYCLDLYDPSNNVYIGYIEFVLNSIDVYLNKYDEYYVDIYGLISL